MKTMTVGELKTRFSEALDAVRGGETIVVEYGRNHEKVAAMVPYSEFKAPRKRRLGLLRNKVRMKLGKGFAIDDDELLSS